MGTLITNEWLKLIKKRSTSIMLLLLVLMTAGISSLPLLAGQADSVMANDMFSYLSQMCSFVNLFVVVVTASMVAEEFSRGTIKFLLIRPYTRSQILFSKFIVSILFSVVATAVVFVSSLVFSNLFLTAESPFASVAGFDWGNGFTIALANAGTNLWLGVLYISITLFLSAVIRSQSLAVGVGVGVLFGSTIVNSLFMMAMQKYDWLKWSLFNMLNIRSTLQGYSMSMFKLNVWEMAAGIAAYSIVIYLLTNLLFKKRDVSLS